MFGFIKNAIKKVADQITEVFNDIVEGDRDGNEIEVEAESEEEIKEWLEEIGAEEDPDVDDGNQFFTHRCRYEYQIANHYHGGGGNRSCTICIEFDKAYSYGSYVEITYDKFENGETLWAGDGDEHLLNSWFSQMDDTQKEYVLSSAENREDIKVDTHRSIAPYMIDDETGDGECKCWLKFISHRIDGITEWEGK